MLEVIDLECARGDRPLFEGLSFSLDDGEFLHLRGQNGRGKTTLLRAVTGLSAPAAGEIRWKGTEIGALGDAYRRELAYVGHLNALEGELTALENLRIGLCLHGERDADPQAMTAALARMGLEDLDLPAKYLSQGQKRRLALARLLVLERPLWILDEPFTSLDVDAVEFLTELFDAHLLAGGVVIATSHQPVRLRRPRRELSLDP